MARQTCQLRNPCTCVSVIFSAKRTSSGSGNRHFGNNEANSITDKKQCVHQHIYVIEDKNQLVVICDALFFLFKTRQKGENPSSKTVWTESQSANTQVLNVNRARTHLRIGHVQVRIHQVKHGGTTNCAGTDPGSVRTLFKVSRDQNLCFSLIATKRHGQGTDLPGLHRTATAAQTLPIFRTQFTMQNTCDRQPAARLNGKEQVRLTISYFNAIEM